jgi:hypothetical protein
VRVLFSALHFAYFRNFEPVVRALAQRGHAVHLAADEPETFGGQQLVERLAAEYPAVTWGWTPDVEREPWFPAAQKVRYALDYVRFLDPRYDDAAKLRLRNVERTPRVVRWLASWAGHRATVRALTWTERMLPRSAAVDTWLAEQRPDVLLLASLTYSRSSNLEQLKAARVAGIPTAACVMSWDHLSSKALLHIQPDLTLVWNDVQKQEGVEMHGLPSDRIVATGAQCYDHWFDRRPTRTREQFCRAIGLDPERPFVLYVCSAMSPVPDPVEPVFVRDWVRALRASQDPRLARAGVLIRPHPERLKEWTGVTLERLPDVVVHGANPIDDRARADYFDSIYYSAAVVGLCTSAFLEAAIVGRPVLSLLLPAYRLHQEGMAHFRYLLHVGGGLLQTAPTLDAHLPQLAAAVAAPPGRDARNVEFLTTFIRPAGLDVPATPSFVEQVEHLARSAPRREPSLQGARAARAVVGRAAVAANTGIARWLMMDAIDIARARGEDESARQKQALLEQRAAYRAGKAKTRGQALREEESRRRAKSWQKWRRSLNARKQVARLKGSVKHFIGARQQ